MTSVWRKHCEKEDTSIYAVLLDGNETSSLSQALGGERSINYSFMMTTKTGDVLSVNHPFWL